MYSIYLLFLIPLFQQLKETGHVSQNLPGIFLSQNSTRFSSPEDSGSVDHVLITQCQDTIP